MLDPFRVPKGSAIKPALKLHGPPVDVSAITMIQVPSHSAELRFGPDLVRHEDGFVVIYSPRDMDGWSIREFCRPVIWFHNQRFFVRAKEHLTDPRLWKYSLAPWPGDDFQPSPVSITYSADFVAEREQAFHSELLLRAARCVLLPFYPVLGFLWSPTKERLDVLGFNPRSLTSTSLMLQFGGFLLLGIFVGYLGMWSARNGILLAALGLDLLVRYDSSLNSDHRPLGFLEWCWRRG